jgi:hypothetical protein
MWPAWRARGTLVSVPELGVRLRGYRLARVKHWPDQVHLELEQPFSMTPIRIKLFAPTGEPLPDDLPQVGQVIETAEWDPESDGSESLTIWFANLPPMRVTCRQVVVDVF